MSKFLQYIFAGLMLWHITSCKSHKDLIYLQDLESSKEFLRGLPKEAPEYHIKKDDNLYVSILSQNPEMNLLYNPAMAQATGNQTGTQQMYGTLSIQYLNGYLVDEQGNISLPILGKIHVEGATVQQAESKIMIKALEYLKDPTVKVKLLNYKITVLGEVQNPGVYYNYDKSISVLDAISMASGNTNFARIEKVLVMRHTDQGTETHRINLQVSKSLLNSEAYFLQPDDIVYIEPGRNKNTQLNSPALFLAFSGISTMVLILTLILNNN